MSHELAISADDHLIRIALLQDKKIVEYHEEQPENAYTVGDIYLGTVRKTQPGLNAAFIDIGYEKDAFLHYLDLGMHFNTMQKYIKSALGKKNVSPKLTDLKYEDELNKLGKIGQILHRNQSMLVQISKEPISTKGPRLTCELSIAGRYLVLVPFSTSVNVSKKITSKEERQRLLRLISSIKPTNFGVIVRTVAEGQDVKDLDGDLQILLAKWEQGVQNLRDAKPRDKIIGEMSRTSAILRDMLNENFDNVVTDNKEIFDEVKTYIRLIAPEKEKITKLHQSKSKLFEHLGIEKQLKSLFGKSVSLANGGYLIIEHTEALHVIDVNSGNKSVGEDSQESTALSVNLEAAEEIARQLRIRDMGGIIVIDFIDMRSADHKRQVYDKMRKEMQRERSKFTILPLSKFGLMQITRQRVRPEVNIITKEICPTCGGSGSITASILVADVIQQHIEHLFTKQNEKGLKVHLHPYLYAFFTKGWISQQLKWFFKYWKWVKLVGDTSLGLPDFIITNQQGEEINMNISQSPLQPE